MTTAKKESFLSNWDAHKNFLSKLYAHDDIEVLHYLNTHNVPLLDTWHSTSGRSDDIHHHDVGILGSTLLRMVEKLQRLKLVHDDSIIETSLQKIQDKYEAVFLQNDAPNAAYNILTEETNFLFPKLREKYAHIIPQHHVLDKFIDLRRCIKEFTQGGSIQDVDNLYEANCVLYHLKTYELHAGFTPHEHKMLYTRQVNFIKQQCAKMLGQYFVEHPETPPHFLRYNIVHDLEDMDFRLLSAQFDQRHIDMLAAHKDLPQYNDYLPHIFGVGSHHPDITLFFAESLLHLVDKNIDWDMLFTGKTLRDLLVAAKDKEGYDDLAAPLQEVIMYLDYKKLQHDLPTNGAAKKMKL